MLYRVRLLSVVGLPFAFRHRYVREGGFEGGFLRAAGINAEADGAAEAIASALADKYTVINEPPAHGKDCNEQLMIRLGLTRQKQEVERT